MLELSEVRLDTLRGGEAIGELGGYGMAALLHLNPAMTALHTRAAAIGTSGGLGIANALKRGEATALTTLDLSDNNRPHNAHPTQHRLVTRVTSCPASRGSWRSSRRGAGRREAIGLHPALTSVNLAANSLATCAEALAAALRQSGSLRRLTVLRENRRGQDRSGAARGRDNQEVRLGATGLRKTSYLEFSASAFRPYSSHCGGCGWLLATVVVY